MGYPPDPHDPPKHQLALRAAFLGLLPALFFVSPAPAFSATQLPVSPEAIARLEQQASLANPREQCFLYTELVHAMTEKAGQEIASGEIDQAASTLKQINLYAHLIHLNLARDTKRLKNAQMLMHNTIYRLASYTHLFSGDERNTAQDTLRQLNQVNEELLTQVFNH